MRKLFSSALPLSLLDLACCTAAEGVPKASEAPFGRAALPIQAFSRAHFPHAHLLYLIFPDKASPFLVSGIFLLFFRKQNRSLLSAQHQYHRQRSDHHCRAANDPWQGATGVRLLRRGSDPSSGRVIHAACIFDAAASRQAAAG